MSLKNPVTPPGIDPETVRLVGQRLNHYSTPGPPFLCKAKVKLFVNKFSQKMAAVDACVSCRVTYRICLSLLYIVLFSWDRIMSTGIMMDG